MLTAEFPASTTLLHGQSISGREMPSEHLASAAAIEAHDIIATNRSLHRDGGRVLDPDFGCRFTEGDKHLMHRRDQDLELVEPNLVLPNVCGDDSPRVVD
jgi:hypothetical protein